VYKVPGYILKDLLKLLNGMEDYLNKDVGSKKIDLLKKIVKLKKILRFFIDEEI
jgi:hypothetical protein